MEITGRLTADAKQKVLKNEKTVVNFTIAINDYYKPKGSSEGKQLTTYINCAYWASSRIADHLSKGVVVQLYGRIGVQAYKNMDGDARASITFHCNNIKILTARKDNREAEITKNSLDTYSQKYTPAPENIEDVPF